MILDIADRRPAGASGIGAGRSSELFMQGLVALNARDLDRAVSLLSEASALAPSDWRCLFKLGQAQAERGDAGAAARTYRAAIAHNPEETAVWEALLTASRDGGELEDFVAFCRRQLGRDDASRTAVMMFAQATDLLGRPGEATLALERAVGLYPNCGPLLYQYALLLDATGRPSEALLAHRRAVEVAPRNAGFRVGLALSLLLDGRFERGWRQYEYRIARAGQGLDPARRWDGDLSKGGVILVKEEQGHGDIIQFSRFLPLFPPRFDVIFEVSACLAELLGDLGARVVTKGAERPPSDFECHLASLPLLFRSPDVSMPATGYLTADPVRRRVWAERLGAHPGLKVGLAWAGNPDFSLDHKRSMALAAFRPVLETPGMTFVSLQVGAARRELQGAGPPAIHDWTDDIASYADTAALISELDLVIGVDTSVIHLAGALGRPAWVLSRISPHWTWQVCEDGPWYPSVQQFRQTAPCDWSDVVGRVARALRDLSAAM